MFFYLTKSAGVLMSPSHAIIAIGVLGLVLMVTRFARLGRWLLTSSFVLLLIAGLSPIGRALLLPLEQRFPSWDASRGAPTGIIMIGGVIDWDLSAGRGEVQLGQSAERITAMVELSRRYPDARIVLIGGNDNLVLDAPAEADLGRDLLVKLGVSPSRIAVENRSRSTSENAALGKAVIDPKPGERWLVVTSAMHMPRTIGAFRRAGFPVEAYPVDWRTAGPQDLLQLWSGSFPTRLDLLDSAAHEWLGLIAYRLTGRSSELLPGP